jgi:hypothetical protein
MLASAGKKWLEKIAIHARDELNAGNNLARESLVVRQENIHARLCGAGEMDGIGWRNAKLSPDPCIMVRRVAGEWQDLNERRPECLTYTLHHIAHSLLVRPHKCLPNGERTGAERILSLFHTRKDVSNPHRMYRMLLEPVNEEHRVPINQAHRGSVDRVLPDSRVAEDREEVGRLVVVIFDPHRVRRRYLPE